MLNTVLNPGGSDATSCISSLYPMCCVCDTVSAFMPLAVSSSSLIFSASFFLNDISAVVTNILRAHPSKEPSPLYVSSLVNSVMNPSWSTSAAWSLSPMYRMHTGNMRGARRSYKAFWDLRSPSMHDLISSDSNCSATVQCSEARKVTFLLRQLRCKSGHISCTCATFLPKMAYFSQISVLIFIFL